MQCPRCNSKHIVKNGLKQLKECKVQKYKCCDCNKYFTLKEKFHHLSDAQKTEVFTLLSKGYKKHQIAKKLGVYLRSVQHLTEKKKD